MMRERSRQASSTRAFTLVEMLAVVAVIAVLASLLLPALTRAKAAGQKASCMNNLKQLSIAITLYSGDYSDLLPPNPHEAMVHGGAYDGQTLQHFWTQSMMSGARATNLNYLTSPSLNLLAPYDGGSARIYKCPSDVLKVWAPSGDRKLLRARSYAINHAVGTECEVFPPFHSGRPVLPVPGTFLDNENGTHFRGKTWLTCGRFSDFRSPSDQFVFMDYGALFGETDWGMAFVVFMEESAWFSRPATHHSFGATMSFGDGHVGYHRWLEQSTGATNGIGMYMHVSKSRDWEWISSKTSERLLK